MVGAEVWCMLLVTLSPLNTDEPGKLSETAVKGKIVSSSHTHLSVDFSEYSQSQKYQEDFSKVVNLPTYQCAL